MWFYTSQLGTRISSINTSTALRVAGGLSRSQGFAVTGAELPKAICPSCFLTTGVWMDFVPCHLRYFLEKMKIKGTHLFIQDQFRYFGAK